MALNALTLASTLGPRFCSGDLVSAKNETNITDALWYSNTTNATTIPCMPYPTMPTNAATDDSKSIVRIFYIVILLIGTVGNVLACYIIITRKFMRRVIHIYTFNLAIADLIVIFFYIPVEMVRNENNLNWTMGNFMCSLSYFATPTSLGASICTLVAITLDRHRGVTKPFLWRGDSRRVLKFTIPAIWIIALVSSGPLFFVAKVELHPGGLYCVEAFPSVAFSRVYWIIMFFLQVLLPLAVIVTANTHMICTMTRLSKKTEQVEQHKQHMRMIRMVVLLVLVYAICSSPQHIVFFWFSYGDLEKRRSLSRIMFKVSNLLVIVQSAINPIIYGTGRNDFKRAFKSIFQCTRIREFLWKSQHEEHHTSLMTRRSDDHSQPLPEVCQEIIVRKKSSKYYITDTPPVPRKDADHPVRRISEPVRQRGNSEKTKQKHFSLPNGRGGSLRSWRGIMKGQNASEEKVTTKAVTSSLNYSRQFGSEELKGLLDSPETVV